MMTPTARTTLLLIGLSVPALAQRTQPGSGPVLNGGDRPSGPPLCVYSDYQPIGVGYSWKHTNRFDPNIVFHWDVVSYPSSQYPPDAVRLGEPGNGYIVLVDGRGFCFLGSISGATTTDFVPDVCLTSFADGRVLDFVAGDNQFILLRRWENLDHPQIGVYGIDPALKDVIVQVYYDTSFMPNGQNTILESGLGASLPGAVTDICFLQKGVGPIAQIGVDAATGVLGPFFDAVASFDCNGNQVQDYLDISFGSPDVNMNCIPDECELLPSAPLESAPAIVKIGALIASIGFRGY